MRRVRGLALAAACVGVLTMPAAAAAGPEYPYCSAASRMFSNCRPPAAPPPATPVDPGGSEEADVAVPPSAKAFGFAVNLRPGDALTPEAEAAVARQAGARYERVSVGWQYLQYKPSDPPLPAAGSGAASYLAWLDRRYRSLVAAGIRPVISVMGAPVWASRFAKPCPATELRCPQWRRNSDDWVKPPDGQPDDHYAGYYFPDASDRAQLEQFMRFHVALAGRYPRAWFEGWNEPNLYYDTEQEGRWWEPWAPSPEDMVAIQCAAYRAVKASYPGRPFIGPSLLHLDWNFRDYVNRVFAAGGASCWDAFVTHVYHRGETTFGADSHLARALADIRAMKAFHGDGDPIWITETGWPTGGSSRPDVVVSEADQAVAARRLYNRLMSMPDLGGVFFHTLLDLRTSEDFDATRPERYFGFLRADGAGKAAYCAFNGRARALDATVPRYAGC